MDFREAVLHSIHEIFDRSESSVSVTLSGHGKRLGQGSMMSIDNRNIFDSASHPKPRCSVDAIIWFQQYKRGRACPPLEIDAARFLRCFEGTRKYFSVKYAVVHWQASRQAGLQTICGPEASVCVSVFVCVFKKQKLFLRLNSLFRV